MLEGQSFEPAVPVRPDPHEARRQRGRTAHLGGLAAEDQVARYYGRMGHAVVARRWRGKGGEIDLVARDTSGGLIFVEVKKSSSFDAAAAMITPRQMLRVQTAATEYVASEPAGQGSDMRFDVALLDRHGAIEIIENATL